MMTTLLLPFCCCSWSPLGDTRAPFGDDVSDIEDNGNDDGGDTGSIGFAEAALLLLDPLIKFPLSLGRAGEVALIPLLSTIIIILTEIRRRPQWARER